eukprot:scaffold330002_cov46-Prasinocladus_malaysianus.AAC.1
MQHFQTFKKTIAHHPRPRKSPRPIKPLQTRALVIGKKGRVVARCPLPEPPAKTTADTSTDATATTSSKRAKPTARPRLADNI